MNCNEAIEYIHSLEKFGIKPGMERIRALCRALGNPQDSLKFIHVAGTNGKGSVSTMVSNILRKNGFNTGLFISPYVSDFRERIQYNGSMIEKNELADCVEKVKNAADFLSEQGIQPTEFEAVTAAAFVYFKKKNCDFVVLETGLGGRLDSTNIILAPYVCILTSISFDHMAILGDTLEKIAYEKCGIIKFGSETVAYPFQNEGVFSVIKKTCEERKSTLRIPNMSKLSIGEEMLDGTLVSYDGLSYKLPLAGRHMIYNSCTAIEAIKALERFNIKVSDEAIKSGIEASVMPARMELLRKKPIIILDGGHNEGCAEALALFIEKHLKNKRIIMLSSLMADKAYGSYLKKVVPYCETFIATKACVPRALSSNELMRCAGEFCKNCYDIPEPAKAVKAAVNITRPEDALIICGSFYLAGEIRNYLLDL